jgi:heterotetrameric sarcosine oxidase gamma subunit
VKLQLQPALGGPSGPQPQFALGAHSGLQPKFTLGTPFGLQPQSALGTSFGTASLISGFSSTSVFLRERSDIGCILLTTAVDSATIASSASQAAGLELPLTPGPINTAPPRKAIWLSPRSWLIHCPIEEENDLVTHLNAAFPNKLAHAALFTDYLCWIELSGPPALDLLTEGTFLSLDRGGLPVGHAKRTLIAQIPAVIVHERESVWLLAVERSRARYFADWLTAAVRTADTCFTEMPKTT